MQVGVVAAAITFMFLNLDALYRPVANCSLVPVADVQHSAGKFGGAALCKDPSYEKFRIDVGWQAA